MLDVGSIRKFKLPHVEGDVGKHRFLDVPNNAGKQRRILGAFMEQHQQLVDLDGVKAARGDEKLLWLDQTIDSWQYMHIPLDLDCMMLTQKER